MLSRNRPGQLSKTLSDGNLGHAEKHYLQDIVLSTTVRREAVTELVFIGGTALMKVYQLDRYSEDLDFRPVQSWTSTDSSGRRFGIWRTSEQQSRSDPRTRSSRRSVPGSNSGAAVHRRTAISIVSADRGEQAEYRLYSPDTTVHSTVSGYPDVRTRSIGRERDTHREDSDGSHPGGAAGSVRHLPSNRSRVGVKVARRGKQQRTCADLSEPETAVPIYNLGFAGIYGPVPRQYAVPGRF